MKWMKRVCTPPRVGGRERNNLGSPLSISSSSLQLLRALLIGYAAQLTDGQAPGGERETSLGRNEEERSRQHHCSTVLVTLSSSTGYAPRSSRRRHINSKACRI